MVGETIGFIEDHVGICSRCGGEAFGLKDDPAYLGDHGGYLCLRCGDELEGEEDEEEHFD
ncbi:MAG: hypothetical protein ACUVRX_11225 [Actinomycetota bacterium]